MGTLEKLRNKKGIVKGVIYARFSSDNQRDESIDAQVRAITDYAQKNNIMIVGEYVDRARSAKTDDRPEFLQMISDSSKRTFDVVLVHKLDRFARNRQDSIGYRMQLKRYDVSLISVLEYLDSDSPESVILESVLEAMAEYYSLNLAREVMKGMHENALKGKHTGGKPPLGYNVDPETRMLVINESEAKIIRLIFQRVIERVGYIQIIKELNSLGYRTKSENQFSKNSLNSILSNEKYMGIYVFNRSETKSSTGKRSNKSKEESEIIRIEDVVPAIISQDDFKKVQDIKKSRKNSMRGQTYSKEEYLLSGKIICGICGNTFVGTRTNCGRNKNLLVRYGCNRRHRGTLQACDNKEIRREYIEAFVLEKLSDQLFDDTLIPAITEHYNNRIKEANRTDDAQLTFLRKKVRELKTKIDNIVNLMAESGSNALMSKLLEMEEEQYNSQALIDKMSRRSCEYITEDYIGSLFQKGRELLQNRSLPSLKKLINLFVNKVIIYPESVYVLFNFCDKKNIPQHPSPSNNDVAVYNFQPYLLSQNAVKDGGGEENRTPQITIRYYMVLEFLTSRWFCVVSFMRFLCSYYNWQNPDFDTPHGCQNGCQNNCLPKYYLFLLFSMLHLELTNQALSVKR